MIIFAKVFCTVFLLSLLIVLSGAGEPFIHNETLKKIHDVCTHIVMVQVVILAIVFIIGLLIDIWTF
jgi:hypothetical protein